MTDAELFALWEMDLADHEGAKDAAAELDAVDWMLDHPDFGAPETSSLTDAAARLRRLWDERHGNA